jgi:hypothetical protein
VRVPVDRLEWPHMCIILLLTVHHHHVAKENPCTLHLLFAVHAWLVPPKPSETGAFEVFGRRRFMETMSIVLASFTLSSTPSSSLVKGNAPPTAKRPVSERPKCTSIDECCNSSFFLFLSFSRAVGRKNYNINTTGRKAFVHPC